jgi:glycerophosphoryl diester phosphodiesterase
VQALGYRYVETDVRTTADGVPVVFHDEDTSRLTGSPARIADLPLADVAALALQGGERIATLEQALDGFPGLRFNLDLKDAGSVRSVPQVLARTAAAPRVCLTSFSERRVRAVRRAVGPAVCTGLGVGGVALLLAGAPVGPAAVAQLPWVLPGGRRLPAGVVRTAHRRGLAVHVWTVDEPAEMAAALELGVDGIMTDRPAVLRRVLAGRGLWPAS